MNVNFIVTVFNREEYLPGLLDVFASYTRISPHVAISYNGDIDSFPYQVRLATNEGHQLGNMGLTLAGYRYLKANGHTRFIKIGIDCWLLDEDKIIDIFASMEDGQCAYAGNQWFPRQHSWSSDIIFADIRFGDIFENFQMDSAPCFELSVALTIDQNNYKVFTIPERVPVVDLVGGELNRWDCKPLHWVMRHELISNLKVLWDYRASRITSSNMGTAGQQGTSARKVARTDSGECFPPQTSALMAGSLPVQL